MRRAQILFVPVLAVLVLLIGMGVGACAGEEVIPPPGEEEEEVVSGFPITESLHISILDEEALELEAFQWQMTQTELSSQLPYNKHGYYCSKPFFLTADDAIEIIITSDCPISVMYSDDFAGGLRACLFYEETRESESWEDIHPTSSELNRSGDDWEARILFSLHELQFYTGGRSGFYHVILVNESNNPCWCEYTIYLRE